MSEKQMLVFDCETNGLLSDVSEIHCIAIYDSQKKETFVFNHNGGDAGPITEALHWLTDADVLLVIILLATIYLFFGKFILGLSITILLLILLSYLGYIIQT